MDTDDLITVEEAAELLGVTKNTVHSAVQRGALFCYRLYGRRLFARADIAAYKKRVHQNGIVPRGRPKKPRCNG